MDMGKGKAGRAPGRLPDQLDKAAVYGGIVCVAAVLVILITNGEYQDRLADNRLLGLIALALMLPGGILYWLSPHRKIGGVHVLSYGWLRGMRCCMPHSFSG